MTRIEIIELRRRLGLTQTAFGMRLGVSPQTVQKWEQGKSSPSNLADEKLQECADSLKGLPSLAAAAS